MSKRLPERLAKRVRSAEQQRQGVARFAGGTGLHRPANPLLGVEGGAFGRGKFADAVQVVVPVAALGDRAARVGKGLMRPLQHANHFHLHGGHLFGPGRGHRFKRARAFGVFAEIEAREYRKGHALCPVSQKVPDTHRRRPARSDRSCRRFAGCTKRADGTELLACRNVRRGFVPVSAADFFHAFARFFRTRRARRWQCGRCRICRAAGC